MNASIFTKQKCHKSPKSLKHPKNLAFAFSASHLQLSNPTNPHKSPAKSYCQSHSRRQKTQPSTLARYYDPPTGQFTSMDPQYLSTYQAYSYANGNPVSGSDPSGESNVEGALYSGTYCRDSGPFYNYLMASNNIGTFSMDKPNIDCFLQGHNWRPEDAKDASKTFDYNRNVMLISMKAGSNLLRYSSTKAFRNGGYYLTQLFDSPNMAIKKLGLSIANNQASFVWAAQATRDQPVLVGYEGAYGDMTGIQVLVPDYLTEMKLLYGVSTCESADLAKMLQNDGLRIGVVYNTSGLSWSDLGGLFS